MAKEPAWDELEKLTDETLTLGQDEGRAAATERLLRAVARIAHEAQDHPDFRELALDVADAAHAAHSVTFDEISAHAGVETDTPAAAVEEFHVSSVRAQLQFWLDENASNPGAVASLRPIGGVIWIELRMALAEGEEAPAVADRAVPGISLLENYVTSDRSWVRRARLELLLPTFQAYRVSYAGRSFLIPTGDVQSVMNGSAFEERIALGELLDLPGEWEAGATSKSVLVRFRGRTCLLGVEEVTGPEMHLARNVEDAGPELRGLAGVAHLEDGGRAAVLDVYPWLEAHANRARETETTAATSAEPASGRYLVFRASGRRYAVPVERVRGLGRLEGEAQLMRMVETPAGTFHLRDVKNALGIEGESGRMYLALAAKQGTVAWAVDGIEKSTLTIESRNITNRRAEAGLILGMFGKNPSAPVYVLDVDRFPASIRSSRRQRIRSIA